MKQEKLQTEFPYRLLMLTTLMISGCSMCYELIISAVSTYLVGDGILQFSITIGLYMFAMGIGSYLSKFIKNKLFDWFVFVEIGVGVLGGMSSLILFFANIYLVSYVLVMYVEIIAIGTLVGIEIPLLTRIIEENTNNLRITLSTIFCFDYIGGLVGSILFPLLLLPKLGYFSTTFLVGSVNLAVALIIIIRYKKYVTLEKMWRLIGIICLGIMILGMFYSENIAREVENGLYRDKVVLSKQTKYQNIVMTKHKDDVRLFINGNIQFSSMDEYRYHEALVHIPMSVAEKKQKILILGGGDGLALREVLKYSQVEQVTMVDLDGEMIDLCKSNQDINKLNEGSLESEKLQVINMDAYKFLEDNTELYDVILVDLPDPNNESLNKLYTNLFYRLCKKSLTEEGVMCVQSTSPYYAGKAFWCINKTIEGEGFFVTPYHVQVPSFGDWGFQLATTDNIKLEDIDLEVSTKYLEQNQLLGIFAFAKDEIVDKNTLYANTLSRPQLMTYYMEAEESWD